MHKMASSLNAKKTESAQKLTDCELMVTEPTKIHELDSRIEAINGIAKEVESVETVTTEHDAIRSTKIRVFFCNG